MARGETRYSSYGQGRSGDERLATGMGWFSIGLGLAEFAAPGTVAQLIGVRDTERARTLLRAFGAREIATGLAILQSGPDPEWLWARLGGDALDIGTLVRALDDPANDRNRLLIAIAAVAGATAADVYCATQLARRGPSAREAQYVVPAREDEGIRVRKSFTINRQPDVVYAFWRKLENLPQFMRHLESVEEIDAKRSRWRAKAPAGMTVEWEAEIVDEQPHERISWRSIEGARVPNHGTVRFVPAPGARGTEVHVDLEYSPPGGRFGALVGKLFGEEPEGQIADDLRRLKQILEAGEIARSEGSASLRQPAQPAPEVLRGQMASEGGRR